MQWRVVVFMSERLTSAEQKTHIQQICDTGGAQLVGQKFGSGADGFPVKAASWLHPAADVILSLEHHLSVESTEILTGLTSVYKSLIIF